MRTVLLYRSFFMSKQDKISNKRLSQAIIKWYRKNARDLPWRRTQDPYRIWLSEIMLQQTTVRQGTDYYLRFLEKFPTIADLATAPQEAVLKQWEGLGYYSRARNLHATAQHIHTELDGKFPTEYAEIIKLKGVGEYTAAAIASFVYGLPYVVVDGNVLRVMSRLYGLTEPVDLPATKKTIKKLAQALLEEQDPAEFNQSIMEFGALNCTYKKPSCMYCPLQQDCIAFQKGIAAELPVKSKKIKKRKRYFVFHLIVDSQQQVLIQQRGPKDVWQGLYQLPLVERDEPLGQDVALSPLISRLQLKLRKVSECHKQLLTHQQLYRWFVVYQSLKPFPKTLEQDLGPDYKVVPRYQLSKWPFPKVIKAYLEETLPSHKAP